MQKEIRFKSGTTAITVFDKKENAVRETRGGLCVRFDARHKSGPLPYFLRVNTSFWCEECDLFQVRTLFFLVKRRLATCDSALA